MYIAKLLKKPEILLTTILIGNNLVNIGASALASQMTIALFGNAALSAMTGILTLVILIFGEVTPKQLAMQKNEYICLHTAHFVYFLSKFFRPIVFFITIISNSLTRSFIGGNPKKMFSVEHIMQLMQMGESQGIIQNHENQMVKGVFRINETTVSSCMTHRKNVFSLSSDMTVKEAETAPERFTRIPVYKKTPENIVGIVFTKDIYKELLKGNDARLLSEIMSVPLFVPENKTAHQMLTQFRKRQLIMAVVLDEYSGLAGIVTREDVVEEVFGELYDEGETIEKKKITINEDGTLNIRGDASIYNMEDKTGITISAGKSIQTMSGYIIEIMGKIPVKGDKIYRDEGLYTVESVQGNTIHILKLIPETNNDTSS